MLIPAIDIKNGQCVRLVKGKFDQSTVYYENPLEALDFLIKKGFERIHIVNLDGTLDESIQLTHFIQVASEKSCKIQFGGGIRSVDAIMQCLNLGIDYVIVSTLAIESPESLIHLPDDIKSKIILCFDVLREEIMTRGWQNASKKSVFDVINDYIQQGFKTYIVTDIEKDGTLTGPNKELYEILIDQFPTINLIASGGISSKDEIFALDQLGVYGTISGKAIYENLI